MTKQESFTTHLAQLMINLREQEEEARQCSQCSLPNPTQHMADDLDFHWETAMADKGKKTDTAVADKGVKWSAVADKGTVARLAVSTAAGSVYSSSVSTASASASSSSVWPTKFRKMNAEDVIDLSSEGSQL